ncbi:MAG: hypothetical protein H7A49_09620 [Akkermansiaceae bacterium]|nr:hypothetical protein [Akkermansiaceae bacterium]MCP5547792.1 hypothetical protein [Akkermansiaceae bacterium]
MSKRRMVMRALGVLVLVWLSVWGVRTFAASRKVTAERLQERIETAGFADWSGRATPPDAGVARKRERELREIAEMVNRLDFNERERNRQNRGGEQFFRRLSQPEKELFIRLTVEESMNRFMEALDAMPPEQRRKFVEQGLKEVTDGRTEEEMRRAEELGPDLLQEISSQGMRAYFEKSSSQTKLDLAPLMEAINETMQGLRGNEFGPRRQ